MNIRYNVKKYCELRGITQKELAAKLEITDVSLNATLKDGKDPRVSTIKKIADALDVSVADLLSDETNPTAEPTIIEKEVSYLRCPNCGKKINIWAKGEDEHQT